jgi:hypothetical protein
MINKKDIKLMPFTFIVAPILLISLTFVVVTTYQDMIDEKEFIASLSCPELREYTETQVIESKLYFGSELYLIYAEERYHTLC